MATIPVPRTWVTGEVVTAAELNSNVRDAVNFLLHPPMMLRRASGTQSVGNNSWTNLTFATNEADSDGMAGGSSTNFVVVTSGYYRVSGTVAWSTGAGSGTRGVAVAVNSALIGHVDLRAGSSSDVVTCRAEWVGYLPVGAVLNIQAWQDSGGSLSTTLFGSSPRVEILYEFAA